MRLDEVKVGQTVLVTQKGEHYLKIGTVTKKNKMTAFIKFDGAKNSIAIDPGFLSIEQ